MSQSHFAMQKIVWLGGEHDFCLTWKLATVLESTVNMGIMELCNRLNSGTWSASDVHETIRLGLIGGGASVNDAMKLVRDFVEDNPNGVVPSVVLAAAIVNAFLFGVAKSEVPPIPAAPEATADGVAMSGA